jgi:hypothetical protein
MMHFAFNGRLAKFLEMSCEAHEMKQAGIAVSL